MGWHTKPNKDMIRGRRANTHNRVFIALQDKQMLRENPVRRLQIRNNNNLFTDQIFIQIHMSHRLKTKYLHRVKRTYMLIVLCKPYNRELLPPDNPYSPFAEG